MATRVEQLNKDRSKALGELLIAECRAESPNLETLAIMIENGAEVTYKHSNALYWAAKAFKFEVIDFLISHGALNEGIAKTYITNICNYKDYKLHSEEIQPKYFAAMERCVDFYGNRIDVFTPYIVYLAVHGNLAKLYELIKMYYLTEAEVAGAIPVPIIFEIILHNYEDVLAFINKHVKWINQNTFDMAVERGDWLTLEYMVNNSSIKSASPDAISRAVFFGEAPVLDILINLGFRFNKNPYYLKVACEASRQGSTKALEVLLKRGYSLSDGYDNKSIKENAAKDNNLALIAFLNRAGG